MLGGIIHTYQKYDPARFPNPSEPPPDIVSPLFEHMLAYGDLRELTDEELARAVRIDPRQIQGLGPSLGALMEMLKERKRKILAKYETESVQRRAGDRYRQTGAKIAPPKNLRSLYNEAFHEEQLRDLERLAYKAGDERAPFARELVRLIDQLGDKYQIDELASKYEFTGRTSLLIPEALAIKEELESIDRLLNQLEEAAQDAQIGVIDLDELAQFVESAQIDELQALQRQIQEYLRHLAEEQGLSKDRRGYSLTPKAYRLFQGRLLEEIFSTLAAARSGRHQVTITGEGAVELQSTKPYEFGDSIAQMDIPSTFVNAMLRQGPGLPIRLASQDILIHKTRNNPKCATVVAMDMSGSMRYGGQYINVKRMALAIDGLIRREYPGDYLRFVEVFTVAKPRLPGEIVGLLPKPVTIFDPTVRLWADMADPEMSEQNLPLHFTNLQHALQLARQFLCVQDTPNRQIMLITDGLPTAHFDGTKLYMLYPADERTEEATMREGFLCAREGITINMFLLPSWGQSREDVKFAYRLAEQTKGRVFFAGGRDLERYVLWDYVNRRRKIIA